MSSVKRARAQASKGTRGIGVFAYALRLTMRAGSSARKRSAAICARARRAAKCRRRRRQALPHPYYFTRRDGQLMTFAGLYHPRSYDRFFRRPFPAPSAFISLAVFSLCRTNR